jgi:hypothetical protein
LRWKKPLQRRENRDIGKPDPITGNLSFCVR